MSTIPSRRSLGAVFLLVLSSAAVPVRAQLRWTDGLSSTLPEVLAPAVAYDSARQRIVLFGGRNRVGIPQSWTWEWDGTRWSERSPAVRPIARVGGRAVFDPVRNRIVLFGGESNASGQVYGDTWEYDGVDWTQRTFSTAPGARTAHGMVWDTARQRAVLHGGIDPTGRLLGDTWEYDGTNWIPRNTLNQGPQERARHAMAYDAARRRVVLYSGQQAVAGNPTANDLWEWDGASWSARNTSNLPAGRFESELEFDPRTASLHLYGGERNVTPIDDHYELLGSSWTLKSNPPGSRRGHRMLYIQGEGVCVIGGFGDGGYRNDLVRYDTARWLRWPGTTGVVAGSAMARLATSNQLVHFGGFSNGRFFGSTWILEPLADEWRLLSASNGPVARSKHAMAGHPTRNEVLMFGGTDGSPRNDTWIFNGTTWVEQQPTNRPGRRQGHALAWHPASQSYVGFAGRGSTGFWTDTIVFTNGNWTSLQPPVAPVARTDYGLAFDGTSGNLLLFGGADANGARFDDTWMWDGTTWSELQPATRPPARSSHTLTWDERRQRVVLFGGSTTSGELGDTWEWNGTNWLLRTTTWSPSPRALHAAAYDAALGAVVVHGGQAFSPATFYDSTHWLTATHRGTVAPLGVSCSGTTMVSTAGAPCLGATRFRLHLDSQHVHAAAMLVIDTTKTTLDLGGCRLYVPGFAMVVSGITDAGGRVRFEVPIPLDPRLAGGQVDAQGLVATPGGPLLGILAPSNALRITIGD